MRVRYFMPLIFFNSLTACESSDNQNNGMEQRVLAHPTADECKEVLETVRLRDLSPKNVITHDTIILENNNQLIVFSHTVEGNMHYGAAIVPPGSPVRKLPLLVFATGGDGIHSDFDISDFDHEAVQFPNFLGGDLDKEFIILIPSFRGQQLIVGDRKYQSEGRLNDAFDGAASDAIAFLNVALKSIAIADESRIGIYGGSRGGTVALLVASRDKRIRAAIAIAAPTDMSELYKIFPDQFKILFLNDLAAGTVSAEEARTRFLISSPVHFAGELPPLQLHYDLDDPIVPPGFGTRISAELVATQRVHESYFYNESIHGFWTDPKFWKRVQEFAGELKNATLPAR